MLFKLKNVLFYTIFFSSFLFSDEIQSPEVQEQEQTEQPAFLPPSLPIEAFIKVQNDCLKQIDSIKMMIQHIAHLTQIGSLSHVSAANIFNWTAHISSVIAHIEQKIKNDPPTLELCIQTLVINKMVIDTVYNALQSKFQRLEECNIDFVAKRMLLIEISPDVLQRLYIENMHSIANLNDKVSRLGYSATNKFFRGVDRVLNLPLVKPAIKLSVIGLIGYGAYHLGLRTLPEVTQDSIETTWYTDMPKALPLAIAGFTQNIAAKVLESSAGSIFQPFRSGYDYTTRFIQAAYSKLKGDEKDIQVSFSQVIEDVTFDDPRLVGLDYQKELLREKVIKQMLDPDMNSSTSLAIMFTGASRNGKTLMARALCGTINKEFKAAGMHDRIGFREIHHLELSATTLRTIIEQAQQHGPMVLFIDEFHLRKPQTTSGGTDLFEYLTELAVLYKNKDPRKRVFLIAATNRPDLLDRALFQHERFGLVIRFDKPNHEQRKEFFVRRAAQSALILTEAEIISFVAQTDSCSYGDLDQLFQEAKLMAKNRQSSLQTIHIQDAINKLVHHINDKVGLNSYETSIAAAHFAGHVMANSLYDKHTHIELVTIKGIEKPYKERNDWADNKEGVRLDPNKHNMHKTHFGKIIIYNENEILKPATTHDLYMQAKQLIAGALAEELLLGSASVTFHKKDRQKALNLIKQALLEGIEEKELPEQQRHELIAQALQKLAALKTEVKNDLIMHKSLLDTLYQELKTKKLLLRIDIEALGVQA